MALLYESRTLGVARPSRLLGFLGAILVLAGFAVVGVGFVNAAAANAASASCTSACSSQLEAVFNASSLEGELGGAGLAIGGGGLGMVLVSGLSLMAPPPAEGAVVRSIPPPWGGGS